MRRAADEYYNNVVDKYETPVLNIRDASYKNAIIIKDLNATTNRNDLLNELVTELKFNEQLDNVFGLLFVHEDVSLQNSLSVVFILRNVKRFFKTLRSHHNSNDELFYIRIDGSLKEIVDIKCTNYTLAYLKDDPKCMIKRMAFKNVVNMNLHMAWNLFGDDVTSKTNEVESIIVTKEKIFINCKSEIGSLKLQRSLLLNFGTDFDLIECADKLVLLRSNQNSPMGAAYMNDIKIVINT
jgi:hypothetical protein